MRDEHVINMIENAPLSGLTESELANIRAHTEQCDECLRAFEAAQVSALLLRERVAVAETIEPSPFFQTRVLAALRERRAASETSALKRLWNATGALVSSMAATVAALAILTFFAPASQPVSLEVAAVDSSYSAEEVLFDRGDVSAEQMSYEQVLATLYESDDDR